MEILINTCAKSEAQDGASYENKHHVVFIAHQNT